MKEKNVYPILVCLMLLIGCHIFTLSAKADELPALSIELQCDQQEYKKDDIAKVTITVTNNSDRIAKDISITNLLPNGLVYAPQQKQTTFEQESLAPHQSVKHEVSVKLVDVNLPQTGDSSPSVFLLAGAALACIAILFGIKKRLRAATQNNSK